MASFYSILQYVRDPVKDERVNIGVFAFDQERCKFVSTDEWSHVRCVASAQSVPVVKEAIRELRHWKEAEVRKFASDPYGVFNITLPSASTLSPEELLVFISKRVLPFQTNKATGYRVKSQVVSDVRKQFRDKLKDKFGPGGTALLRDRDRLIFSTKVPVNPDVAIGNGQVQSIVQALSFEEKDENKVQRDVSATGFIIRCVREANNPISGAKIGVVCLPPQLGRKNNDDMKRYYDLAIAEFSRNAEVIEEAKMDAWAAEQVDGLHVTL
jgi:hypothetical protein